MRIYCADCGQPMTLRRYARLYASKTGQSLRRARREARTDEIPLCRDCWDAAVAADEME